MAAIGTVVRVIDRSTSGKGLTTLVGTFTATSGNNTFDTFVTGLKYVEDFSFQVDSHLDAGNWRVYLNKSDASTAANGTVAVLGGKAHTGTFTAKGYEGIA